VPAGEDFAFYQEKIPGVFIFLGITPRGQDPSKIALNHSPYFFIDESGLIQGVKALAHTAYGWLENKKN
jgi:metal-dependent amidase/aminoacylase/carboxypeptidase family protein